MNPTLDNAISHDIAANGQAIAEIMDANLGGTDGEDACRLLLAASLANVPNGVVGLSLSEVISYLCTPGRDLSGCRRTYLEYSPPRPGIYIPVEKESSISKTSRTWLRS